MIGYSDQMYKFVFIFILLIFLIFCFSSVESCTLGEYPYHTVILSEDTFVTYTGCESSNGELVNNYLLHLEISRGTDSVKTSRLYMASKVGSQFLQNLESIESVSKLSKRVIRILGMNPGPMTLQGTNTYLVGTGAKRLLIDTGSPDIAEYQSILRGVLEQTGISIERILLTHWHRDHVGGLRDVFNIAKPTPLLHKFISNNTSEGDNTFLPDGASYQYVSDGDEFQVEGATLRVLHTPGHTDDHMSILLKEENSMFCGDSILGQRSTTFEDLSSYMKSLELIKSYKPELLYPGHGIVIENAVTFLCEYIQHRNSRDEQILETLKKSENPLLIEELLSAIYSDISDNLLIAAKRNLLLHLGKLEEEKRICKIDNKWDIPQN
ncbi:Beta-lactamase-like protein 2 [Oopsacas minuta]|uniref:Beta-lactamase-like protein 2 n=1 Tax=Oopsacas minuta TaxID=111878 RepID=A0AAV7KJJ8_9METZ|nr:Beta-lactamase-like protein 2 [Oopsacas minuta]